MADTLKLLDSVAVTRDDGRTIYGCVTGFETALDGTERVRVEDPYGKFGFYRPAQVQKTIVSHAKSAGEVTVTAVETCYKAKAPAKTFRVEWCLTVWEGKRTVTRDFTSRKDALIFVDGVRSAMPTAKARILTVETV